jgi:serine protease Do
VKAIYHCVLVVSVLAGSGFAWGNETAYRRTLRSTVMILAMSEDGLSCGSGVVVDDTRRWVLTTHHVIGDASNILVLFPRFNAKGKLVAEKAAYLGGKDKMAALVKQDLLVPAHVVFQKPEKDLVLLQLKKLPRTVRAIRLAENEPEPGQTVHCIGNPGVSDALWVYSDGKVRQVYRKQFTTESDQRIDTLVVETTSPVNHGDSGGPVVNDDGELVALVESFTRGSRDQPARLISLFIHVEELKVLLEEAREKNEEESGTMR